MGKRKIRTENGNAPISRNTKNTKDKDDEIEQRCCYSSAGLFCPVWVWSAASKKRTMAYSTKVCFIASTRVCRKAWRVCWRVENKRQNNAESWWQIGHRATERWLQNGFDQKMQAMTVLLHFPLESSHKKARPFFILGGEKKRAQTQLSTHLSQ